MINKKRTSSWSFTVYMEKIIYIILNVPYRQAYLPIFNWVLGMGG